MEKSEVIDIQSYCSSIPSILKYDSPVAYFDGSYDNFFNKFLCANKPCIIRNVVEGWNSALFWTAEGKPNFEYLCSHYGDCEVTVANCNERYYNAQLKTTVKFSDFVEYWRNFVEADYPTSQPCLYLKDWHLIKDFPNHQIYKVPPFFCSDWLNEFFCAEETGWDDDYRFVYMGPKGSWTPMHVDVFTSYSWSVNICGIKKWILFPPGEEEKLKDKYGTIPYDVEYLEKARDCNISYFIVQQHPGEALFIPSGWYHQVWNLDDTISINHNWVNACNLSNMFSSLMKNFYAVKNEILEFRDTMDNWLGHCQLLLKSCYGMDFNDFHNFLSFILNTRKKVLLSSQKNMNVFGGWVIGPNHLEMDLKAVCQMLNTFLNQHDVKLYFGNCSNSES